MRALIVSQNDSLLETINQFFNKEIESGDIEIDWVKNKRDAIDLLKKHNYDRVFQNGIHVIDAIERYQTGSEVYHFGKSKNNIYKNILDPEKKKEMNNFFTKKTLYSWVTLGGGALGILSIVTAFVIYLNTMRVDVDHNVETISDIKQDVTVIKEKVDDTNNEISKISGYIEGIYKNSNNVRNN